MELNEIAPNRDKSSDGTIGDTAHQSRVSDHNDDERGAVPIRDADTRREVHALDLDTDLREPGLTMQMVVDHVLRRCRAGTEKRLRYIIFDGWIYEASNGWKRRTYSGDNKHRQHAHFSASYETKREADTSSWGLEEIEVAMTDADKKWIEQAVVRAVDARADLLMREVPAALLAAKINDKANPGRMVGDVLRDLAKLRGYLVGDVADTQNAAIAATSPLVLLTERVKALFVKAATEGAKS